MNNVFNSISMSTVGSIFIIICIFGVYGFLYSRYSEKKGKELLDMITNSRRIDKDSSI